MQFSSPYNTYRNAGLPPGPIGNPSLTSLEAAMHPTQSDYYYFVADAAGHHRFAHTIEEHNKNVAAYRRAMRGQQEPAPGSRNPPRSRPRRSIHPCRMSTAAIRSTAF